MQNLCATRPCITGGTHVYPEATGAIQPERKYFQSGNGDPFSLYNHAVRFEARYLEVVRLLGVSNTLSGR